MEVEVVKLTHLTCPIFFGVSSIPRGGGGGGGGGALPLIAIRGCAAL